MTLNITVKRIAIINVSIKKTNSTLNHCAVPFINLSSFDIAKDTVNIKAKVLWLQLGIKSEKAKKLIKENNIEYIEDRCTKMEYQKHFLKMRQAFPVLQELN